MSEARMAPVSQKSQGQDSAVCDTSSRGFHSLSLDPAQTALSFRRDLSFLRARHSQAVTVLWCDAAMLGKKEAESRAWLDGRCFHATLHACVRRPSGDLASRCRLQVAISRDVMKRAVYT